MRAWVAACLLLVAAPAWAGYTETLPKGVFLLDERFTYADIRHQWNNAAQQGPLLQPIKRYEPGGALQGTITSNARATYDILVNMLLYGIADNLAAVVAVPVVLDTTVRPRLGWIPGDYSPTLGRPYSQQDFWEWAGSMGQPKPGKWSGNHGALSDIVLGARWRFTDNLEWFAKKDMALAVTVFGALPTGAKADPESITSQGITSWNLFTQGELCLHLSADKFFHRSLDGRLVIGLDAFYEAFLPRKYLSGTGAKNPLLLNARPYVGKTYTIDPGDFAGAQLEVDIIPYKGPEWHTWLTRRTGLAPWSLPPMLTVKLSYNFTYVGQSYWKSKSALWDWEHEKAWRPGYKNILYGEIDLNLFRLAIPVELYASVRNLTLLHSRNVRAPNVVSGGLRLPFKL